MSRAPVLSDIEFAKAAILGATGRLPDVVVCSGRVLLQLRPDLVGTVVPGKLYRVADGCITEEVE